MSFAGPPDRDARPYTVADGSSLGTRELDGIIATPDALRTLFQPIVRVARERWTLHALECLSRASDVPPQTDAAHLFAAARSFGREVALDRACVAHALDAARKWDVRADLFLNLDPRTLDADASFPDFLVSTAGRAGIAPDRLTIEITEHGRDGSPDTLAPAVRVAQALGVRVAFDDIGVGSCDQRAILACRPDVVKLDGQACRAARGSSRIRRELGAIAGLARRSGSIVIAEGIECPDDAAVMADLGIDLAQGRFYCPPLHAEHAGDAAAVVARRAILASRQRPTPPPHGSVRPRPLDALGA
ncbi:MAG TPA: EAL domain-containing protein [Gemmatimonadaceae bacterium]